MALKRRGKTWYVRFQGWRAFGPTGFMKSAGTSHKTLAGEMETAIKAEFEKGDPKGSVRKINDGTLTLPEWFRNRNGQEDVDMASDKRRALVPLYEEWLAWLPRGINRQKNPYKPRTIDRYGQAWRQILSHLPKSPKFGDLNQDFLIRYERERSHAPRGASGHIGKGPLSASAWNNDMTALQSFLTWCEDVKRLNVPTLKIKKRRQPKKKVRWLTPDEIETLKDYCDNDWWVFFRLLMTTGLRFMEAICLRPCDFKDGEVHVRFSKTHDGEARSVPMQPDVSRLLLGYINRHGIGPRTALFQGWDGEYSHTGYELWRNRFDLVVKASGIDKATMHDLRDTFAVYCRKAGVSLADLRDLLGHGSVTMTEKYANYGPDADERKAQVKGLGKLMGETEGTNEGTIQIVKS